MINELKKFFFGIGYGIISFVVGLVITTVLVIGRIAQYLRGSPIDPGSVAGQANQAPEVWQIIGWIFYSEHFFQIRVEVFSALGAAATQNNSFALYESGMWNPILFAIPAVTILFCGYVAGYRDSTKDAISILSKSIGVTTGYIILATVGIILSTVSLPGVQIYPEFGHLPILIGYVLLLSVVGSGVASLTANSTASDN